MQLHIEADMEIDSKCRKFFGMYHEAMLDQLTTEINELKTTKNQHCKVKVVG